MKPLSKTTKQLKSLKIGRSVIINEVYAGSIGIRAQRLGIKVATRRITKGKNFGKIKVFRIE